MKKSVLFTAIGALALLPASLHAAPEIGQPAPEFTLTDTNGNEHSLSDFEGKIVVLEWTNHGCPFVVKHYKEGHMQALQEKYGEKDVVWLKVCSSAPGTQGHMSPEDANKKIEELNVKAAAYLLDEDGTVGKLYDAKVTPEMYVINKDGILVYKGAIDSVRSTDSADIEDATNYVVEALTAVKEGNEVETTETQAYGCTVKYAN